MPMVSLQDVHVMFGSDVIFDKANLRLFAGEKLGLVGPNGSGKTTLLKLILGSCQPDTGNIDKRKNLRIGYLPQEPSVDPNKTVLEELHAGAENILKLEHEIEKLSHNIANLKGNEQKQALSKYDRLLAEFQLAGGFEFETRVKETTAGLGLDESTLNQKCSTLSGGQLSRLGLAKVLLAETDLLLLDEPTNHLDWEAGVWLERFLKNYKGAALIVSHDRFLLDRLVTKIVEIRTRNVTVYPGNYTNYRNEREKRDLELQRQYQARLEFVEKTKDFIARNKDQEGMRKTARGRKTRLEKLLKENPEYLEKPMSEQELNFEFANTKKSGTRLDVVIQAKQLTKQYDNLTLFDKMNFELLRSQRLGIIGPNGTGKTTLLEILLGTTEPTNGQTTIKSNLTVGYLDQTGAQLNSSNDVLDEITAVPSNLDNEKLRTILGAFLFKGDDVFKKVANLSGGERNRLALCKLVLSQPDILILDEPTNHLDIPSIEALENALAEYQGTIVLVTHDRYFLNRIADHILVIGADTLGRKKIGQHEFLIGTYSDYEDTLENRNAKNLKQKQTNQEKKKQKKKTAKNTTPPELKQFNAWSIEKIESAIEQTEIELIKLREKFGDDTIYRKPEKLQQLQQKFEQQQQTLNLLYQAYERRL